MFSKLPQRFTAPFGLLGDEQKLAFPSQPGGIMKLSTVRNIPQTDSYWDQYFILFDSPSDVYSLILPIHIRRALIEAPENVATLVTVVTSRLFNLVSDHTFPSPSPGVVSSFASSIINGGAQNRNTTKEVLNCLRILQRVLPSIFEMEDESNSFEHSLFWHREIEDAESHTLGNAPPQFVIEDEDECEQDGDAPGVERSTSPKGKPKKFLPSLSERLFSCLIDLMFCCGFTIPIKLQVDHYKINYVIWERGVGSTIDPGPTQTYDSNKTEVLRTLLVLLSRQIYVSPGALFTQPSQYTLHLVQMISRRDVLTILCSLLNTAMNSTNMNDSGIGSMAGKLPYNHLVFKGEDTRTNLVCMCLQVLCAVLDFQSGSAKDQMMGSGDSQHLSPMAKTNAFRYFLMKLHRSRDFDFILAGVMNILDYHLVSSNNLFPGARKSLPYVTETIIFLWKIIELNKKFRAYIVESDKSNDVLVQLMSYCISMKDRPQQHGLCRAISYMVQTLSSETGFGQKLESPTNIQLPAKWVVPGSTADFFVNSIHVLVSTTSGTLHSVYPALIIALSNTAPYIKGLTTASSIRLLQLFSIFSSPSFLLSDTGHPRLLFFLLESFNAIIYHHISKNPNLIYSILLSHKAFEDLGTFTLAWGVREIKRAQAMSEEQAAGPGNGVGAKGKILNDINVEGSDPGAEKARLLENELSSPVDPAAHSGTNSQFNYARVSGDQEMATMHALMSPSTEFISTSSGSPTLSEKARGKMRERPISLDTSLEGLALSSIGRNGFIPTQEWVTSWQRGLPLDTIMVTISELLPKIQEMQVSRKTNSTSSIVDFLSAISLDHVLSHPPVVSTRNFTWSDASIIWWTSLIWGEIYVRGMSPLAVWNATNVRLFFVKHTYTQPRQITEAVSNVVGGLLRRGT